MSRLILHRAFGSPAARAVQMLADLIAVPLEIKEVNVIKQENRSPAFRKLNPMQTVPVIEDGDFVLSESHAIMKYLLEKYGGDKGKLLYPSELRTRAIIDQCMYFNAAVFFIPLLHVVRKTFAGKITETPKSDINSIESAYSVLEAYLENKKYVAADHLTLADLSNGSTAVAIQVLHKLDSNKFPQSADWLSRLQEEHVFKSINAPGANYLAKMITKGWENNKLKNNEN